jgi:hypothetical protein
VVSCIQGGGSGDDGGWSAIAVPEADILRNFIDRLGADFPLAVKQRQRPEHSVFTKFPSSFPGSNQDIPRI